MTGGRRKGTKRHAKGMRQDSWGLKSGAEATPGVLREAASYLGSQGAVSATAVRRHKHEYAFVGAGPILLPPGASHRHTRAFHAAVTMSLFATVSCSGAGPCDLPLGGRPHAYGAPAARPHEAPNGLKR